MSASRWIEQELRKFRDLEAKRQGIEAYKILQNQTIAILAREMPETNLELLNTKGIGPTKAKKYGASILRIIADAKETPRAVVEQSAHAAVSSDPKSSGSPSEQRVYSVGEFLDVLNRALGAKTVSVKGEITEAQKRGSNWYFTIKDADEDASLSCFARDYSVPTGIDLAPGQEVVAVGFPSIYKPSGRFSLHVEEVLLSGEGLLLKAFEELKKKLTSEGLFAPERKKEVPRFVQKIGLVTAKDSQALEDFKKNIGRYGFHILHKDVRVQGAQSVAQVVEALEWFNKFRSDVDVIVLVRGGGSLEDLQSFNSEQVARAIVASKIPVICGVGHEGDISIADMVADVRVSTPTAAARLVSEDWRQAGDQLAGVAENLSRRVRYLVDGLFHELRTHYVGIAGGARAVFSRFREVEERFRSCGVLLVRTVDEYRRSLGRLQLSLSGAGDRSISSARSFLNDRERSLASVNPELKLKQGYSIAFAADGSVIKGVKDVRKGEVMKTRFIDGDVNSEVI